MNNPYSLKFFCIQYYIIKYNKYPECILTLKEILNFEIQNFNIEILKWQLLIHNFNKIDITTLYKFNDINNYRIEKEKLYNYKFELNRLYKIKPLFYKYLYIVLNKIYLLSNNNYIIENIDKEDYYYLIIDRLNIILARLSNKNITYSIKPFKKDIFDDNAYYQILIKID